MAKLFYILLLVFGLLAVHAKEVKKVEETEEEETSADNANEDEGASGAEQEEKKEFTCNLKYKKIGCYKTGEKKEKSLKTFLMTDAELGGMDKKAKVPNNSQFNDELPKFACKCANEALTNGNAIFGLENIAECWTGPDDSKYDKDGGSEDCITFDYAQCLANSELCTGKKHANFMYYIDSPEHTRTQEDIEKELLEEKKKEEEEKKKEEEKSKKKKKSSKKSKSKGKKSKN